MARRWRLVSVTPAGSPKSWMTDPQTGRQVPDPRAGVTEWASAVIETDLEIGRSLGGGSMREIYVGDGLPEGSITDLSTSGVTIIPPTEGAEFTVPIGEGEQFESRETQRARYDEKERQRAAYDLLAQTMKASGVLSTFISPVPAPSPVMTESAYGDEMRRRMAEQALALDEYRQQEQFLEDGPRSEPLNVLFDNPLTSYFFEPRDPYEFEELEHIELRDAFSGSEYQ